MQRAMQILGILLALALVFVVAKGLGLTNMFKGHKGAKKEMILEDFEKVRNLPDDENLGWTTNGYASLVATTEKMTHGKRSAMAVFLKKDQFYPAPTHSWAEMSAPPSATPEEATPVPGEEWEPQVIMDTHSVKSFQYPQYEWQDYAKVKFDVFNPQDRPITYTIQIVDSHSYTYEKSGPLTIHVFNNLEIPIDDLAKQRLDTSNIMSFRFGVDMSGATEPVTLFLDYLRLEGDATPPGKMPPSPKQTPVNSKS